MMRLEDACELIVDCPHSTARDEGKGFPLIRTPNIGRGRFLLENVHRVSESVYNKRNARAVPKDDDIILAREAPAGNVAIIKNGVKMCLGQRTVLLRPNKEVVNPDFLTYFLLAPEQQYGLLGTANGATVAHVNIPTIRNLKIKLPPLKTQERIGKILSAYDDLIENNQRQIKLLEEAAQRLYKEWFVDLRFPGHENTKITDGVPEGWEYKPIFDVFDFVRGRSYTSNELSDSTGVLMVNLKNIRAFGGYNRNAEKRFVGQFKDNQILSAGDVIMGVTDMTQERRLVGHVALVPNMGETMIFSMDLIKLIPKRTDNLFLYSAMIFGGVSKRISPLANGVNVLHLKPEAIMGVEMLIPNDKVVCRYHSQMAPVFSEIETLQKQCDIAAEARDRLLSKLMNGEIRGG